MTTVIELENKVREWVELISLRECYIQEQMGPIPVDPYCTIYFKELAFAQYDVVDYQCVLEDPQDPESAKSLVLTVRGQAMVTFAISAWGGTAAEVMTISNRLRNSIQADPRWTDLWTVAGKGLVGPITSIPEDFEGERRQRTEFNLTLHTALQDNLEVDHFNETEITCTIDGNKVRTVVIGIDDDTFNSVNLTWEEIESIWELLG